MSLKTAPLSDTVTENAQLGYRSATYVYLRVINRTELTDRQPAVSVPPGHSTMLHVSRKLRLSHELQCIGLRHGHMSIYNNPTKPICEKHTCHTTPLMFSIKHTTEPCSEYDTKEE